MNGAGRNIQFDITKDEEGARLDLVLSLCIEDTSRSYIQKQIAAGNVKVDGETCTVKKQAVKEGQRVEISLPLPKPLEVKAEEIELDIVYEDDDVLVVNKPSGMVVHPAPGNEDGTLVNALLYHCGNTLSGINGILRPGIVHRIDKDTSGLLMVAKNDNAHRGLARQLEEHSIDRVYTAIVYNNFTEDEGTVDAPIGRDENMRKRRSVTAKNSKRAVTHYKVLERFGNHTLIEARLETGRTHQIRVHMAHIGHPLLGDELYSRSRSRIAVNGQMLHASVLGFTHPVTGERMVFESELPDDFVKVIEKLR